jgi:hypothetical protein
LGKGGEVKRRSGEGRKASSSGRSNGSGLGSRGCGRSGEWWSRRYDGGDWSGRKGWLD